MDSGKSPLFSMFNVDSYAGSHYVPKIYDRTSGEQVCYFKQTTFLNVVFYVLHSFKGASKEHTQCPSHMQIDI